MAKKPSAPAAEPGDTQPPADPEPQAPEQSTEAPPADPEPQAPELPPGSSVTRLKAWPKPR